MTRAWGDPINTQRQLELTGSGVESEGADESTLANDSIELTGADVFWLAETRQGSGCDAGLDLSGARLPRARLHSAELFNVQLAGARLDAADLSAANLTNADLTDAKLQRADLRGTFLTNADLKQADLRLARFNEESQLQGVQLDGAFLEGATLGTVDLSVVDWESVRRLGDEIAAVGAEGHRAASRAYRMLSLNLRSQGVTGSASRFHYRSEVMWRDFLFQKAREAWKGWVADAKDLQQLWTATGYFLWAVVSWVFGFVAGYGVYHLWRLFVTYLALIVLFSALSTATAPSPHTVGQVWDLLILSVTSFHGRGLQPHGPFLTDAVRSWAALEAVVGLVIEALFIAAFTRRVMRI